MEPYFSICIPTYNRKSYLSRALGNLEKQSDKDFEVLVVDDGSTDGTDIFINQYINDSNMKIKYFEKENGGKYTALNIGIREAAGKYFLILDSDDYLLPNTLQNVKSLASQYDDQVGIMGKVAYKDGTIIGNNFPTDNFKTSYIDFHFGSGFSLKGNRYSDCCEFNLTRKLKQFSFPINEEVHFIPESYLFDQLGLEEDLIATNTVFRITEYLADGITSNYNNSFIKENTIGYLYKYVNNIDVIFKNKKIKFLPRLLCWINYWNVKSYDVENKGPNVARVSFIGKIAKFILPFALKIKKYRK